MGLQKGDIFWEYDDWVFLDYSASDDIKAVQADLLDRILAKGDTKRHLVILRNGQLKTFEVAPGRLGVNIIFTEETLPKDLRKQRAPSPDKP
jgi:hypothetical protein